MIISAYTQDGEVWKKMIAFQAWAITKKGSWRVGRTLGRIGVMHSALCGYSTYLVPFLLCKRQPLKASLIRESRLGQESCRRVFDVMDMHHRCAQFGLGVDCFDG